MKQKEYAITDNCFAYDGKIYDCSYAIKRDIPIIIQEAENSHNDSFDVLYDKQSLKAEKVRIYFDENNKPTFGIVIYTISLSRKYLLVNFLDEDEPIKLK